MQISMTDIIYSKKKKKKTKEINVNDRTCQNCKENPFECNFDKKKALVSQCEFHTYYYESNKYT